MRKTEFSVEEVVELLAGTGSKEWNECISTRLESVDAHLHQDAWTKGIGIYLRALQGGAVAKLLNQEVPADAVGYLRGFAAALRVVICLPQSVSAQIEQEQNKSEKKGPQGTAGY